MRKNYCSYPVEFVEDIFGESSVLADTLKTVTGAASPRVMIVADQNVVQRTEGIGTCIGRYVQKHGITLAGSPVVLTGGERTKADSLQSALKVISALLSAKIGANDVVLALGGGTILDVAGYAAAQVRGGVKVVRVPTTPAAMMDAAYATYAAVDSATVKDALRVPCEPAAVLIDISFAATVLDGVWRGGLSEAVRFALASDAALYKKIAELVPAYVARDAKALDAVVRAVRETRAKKDATPFALWSAMRLESMSGYKLPHGYAVSIGICIDLGYSAAKGLLKESERDAAVELLRSCGALDGMIHSSHLIGQAENLFYGIDAWALAAGTPGITVLKAIGKSVLDPEPDRALLKTVVKGMVSLPPTS